MVTYVTMINSSDFDGVCPIQPFKDKKILRCMKQSIDDFVKYIEKEHNIEIVRSIKVVYKDGKKRPYGEKSSMSVAQIRENRCSVDDPNTYSIAIKYVPNFYCIDFDYFDGEPINDTMEYEEMVERSPLAKLLDDNDCFRIKTKKGWHFYVYINDFPIFQNNTNVGNDEKFDIDMFMTNWILHLYLNTEKTDLFKNLSFERLIDIAYCLDTKIYEVSNFYHGIKKPHGIFKYITLDKCI